MKALEDKILKEGKVFPGNILKVGSFLNHQLDVAFLMEVGAEISRLYKDSRIDKILTIETSGIAIAFAAACHMNLPVVFAKKNNSYNLSNDVYCKRVESFTHKNTNNVIVSKEFLHKGERVLIIDDFLAVGNALVGLLDICREAEVEVVGCAIAIEKAFQGGGDKIRSSGIRVESLAIIEEMTDNTLIFRKQ